MRRLWLLAVYASSFVNDSAILGLLSDDIFLLANYQDAVDIFSQRCETYFLELDVSKIKESVID